MRAAILLLLLVGLASACDSDVDCGTIFQVTSRPELISVYLPDGSSSTVVGGESLSYSRGPEDLAFSAQVLDGEIASARLVNSGDTLLLTIDPVSAGSTELLLHAEDECGGVNEITIAVNSIDICDASGLTGHDVFFPVETGLRQEYLYASKNEGRDHPTSSVTATRTWEIHGQPTCHLGVRTFVIRETTEGTVTQGSYEGPVSYTRNLTGSFVGRRLEIDDYTDRLPLPDLHWLVRGTSPDSISVEVVSSWRDVTWHVARTTIILEKDVGLVRWRYSFDDKYGTVVEEMVLNRDGTDPPDA